MFRQQVLKVTIASVLTFVSTSASALGDQWYMGIGGGASLLQPNAVDRAIDVDEDQGQVATFFLGRDFDDRSSGQLQLYSMGEAQFDNGNSDTANYLAGDASLLYRFYDSRDNAQRGKVFGASLYGRFGLGYIDRDSDLALDNDAPVYFGVGAGMETYLTNNLAIRLESLYHESDLASATLSLVGRFGGRQRSRPVTPPPVKFPERTTPATEEAQTGQTEQTDEQGLVILKPLELGSDTVVDEPTAAPADSPPVPAAELPEVYVPPAESIAPEIPTVPQLPDSDIKDTSNENILAVEILGNEQENASSPASTTATLPETEQIPVSVLAPDPAPEQQLPLTATAAGYSDSDEDGVLDGADHCPRSSSGFPVNNFGCPVFKGTLQGVEFYENSTELTLTPNSALNNLAQLLKLNPASRYKIMAHTDNTGSKLDQSNRTRARLSTLAKYLLRQGLSKDQLRNQLVFESQGADSPAFDNNTAEGRKRNNRIAVVELTR